MSTTAPARPDIAATLPTRPRSPRFEHKRTAILGAANTLINRRGVAGTTFGEVAQLVGLNTTSVTYYFRRKEHLVEAAFADTIERLEAIATAAARSPDPRARVDDYLKRHFDRLADTLRGRVEPIATLSEIRALDDAVRIPLERRYQAVFRIVRDFFEPARDDRHRALRTARAFVLEETVFWLPTWLPYHGVGDFDRVRGRLFGILAHGIAPAGADWSPAPVPRLEIETTADPGRSAFLRAATRLINQRGYRGASVERIAAELGVTKGSFYHHLETKDDLVLACFRCSFDRFAETARRADALPGDQWQRLAATAAALLDAQFAGDWPLLRTTALQTLPPEMRRDVVDRSNRIALRVAGTLVDGIAEGSVRPVDPLIAAQAIVASINAAYDLRGWAERMPRDEAIALYALTLSRGLFDD